MSLDMDIEFYFFIHELTNGVVVDELTNGVVVDEQDFKPMTFAEAIKHMDQALGRFLSVHRANFADGTLTDVSYEIADAMMQDLKEGGFFFDHDMDDTPKFIQDHLTGWDDIAREAA